MKLDYIYNSSCEDMHEIDNDSIAMVVTSPPYFDLKEYANWDTYTNYLLSIDRVINECYRVLRPGGWICWNIQEGIPFPPKSYKKYRHSPERYCEPLLAHTINIISKLFLYEKDIIWYKGQGTATQKLFGSYPRPGLILISGLTEHIITARKPRGDFKLEIDRKLQEESILTKEEWAEWAVDLWHIPPTHTSSTTHPAPFPVEIPYRCIRMWTFKEDVILDPYMGSGSTAIAARRCHRKYVGYEIHKNYIANAKDRIQSEMGMFVD